MKTVEQRLIEACEAMQLEIIQLRNRVQYLEQVGRGYQTHIPKVDHGYDVVYQVPGLPKVEGPTVSKAPEGWALPSERSGQIPSTNPVRHYFGGPIGNWHLNVDTPESTKAIKEFYEKNMARGRSLGSEPEIILHPPVEEDGA